MRSCFQRNRKSLVAGVASPLAALLLAPGGHAQHIDEEVVVVATPRDASIGELAQSVTVLGGEELDRVRSGSLGEALEAQLGMSASSFGAGASRPVIRGLAGARVRTLEDGLDSMDIATVSADHAVGIEPLVARQIEIFRGPTTLLYGSGAVGGVVNTVTNRIPELAPEDGIDAAFELRADSVADATAGAVVLDGGGDRFAWHLDATRRDAGDYEIPALAEAGQSAAGDAEDPPGVLENSALSLDSYALGGSWLGPNAFFGVAVSGFASEYGVPAHHDEDADPLAVHEDVRIDLDQTRVDMHGSVDFAGAGALEGLRFRLGTNDYRHVELEGAEIGTRFSNDAREARIELLHAPFGQWNGAIGLQLAEREFVAIGDEAFVPPVDSDSQGLFLIEERDLGSWALSVGARVESLRHRPTSGAAPFDDTAASLSLAAIRELGNGYSLALNLASAERLPVAEELYSFGPHLATGSVEFGDETLRGERSRHLDIGLRKTRGELVWNLTAFVTDFADYVYLRDSGQTDPVELLPVFRYAQGDADFVGVEAEFFAPLAAIGAGELDLRLFGDLVEAKLATGEKLPRIPPRRLGARLEYHSDVVTAGIELIDYDAQDRVAPFETRTAGYRMLNLDLSWRLPVDGSTAVTFFARATNLLDEDARRHASLVKDFAPLPGRNVEIGVRAGF